MLPDNSGVHTRDRLMQTLPKVQRKRPENLNANERFDFRFLFESAPVPRGYISLSISEREDIRAKPVGVYGADYLAPIYRIENKGLTNWHQFRISTKLVPNQHRLEILVPIWC